MIAVAVAITEAVVEAMAVVVVTVEEDVGAESTQVEAAPVVIAEVGVADFIVMEQADVKRRWIQEDIFQR
jgi:hypothetical protein